jgi:hypothetical protein
MPPNKEGLRAGRRLGAGRVVLLDRAGGLTEDGPDRTLEPDGPDQKGGGNSCH